MRVTDFMREVDYRSQGGDGRYETWACLFTTAPDGSRRPIYVRKYTMDEWEAEVAAYMPVQQADMDRYLADFRATATGGGEFSGAGRNPKPRPTESASRNSDSPVVTLQRS